MSKTRPCQRCGRPMTKRYLRGQDTERNIPKDATGAIVSVDKKTGVIYAASFWVPLCHDCEMGVGPGGAKLERIKNLRRDDEGRFK